VFVTDPGEADGGMNVWFRMQGLGELSAAEKKGVKELITVLRGNIDKGVSFVKGTPAE